MPIVLKLKGLILYRNNNPINLPGLLWRLNKVTCEKYLPWYLVCVGIQSMLILLINISGILIIIFNLLVYQPPSSLLCTLTPILKIITLIAPPGTHFHRGLWRQKSSHPCRLVDEWIPYVLGNFHAQSHHSHTLHPGMKTECQYEYYYLNEHSCHCVSGSLYTLF